MRLIARAASRRLWRLTAVVLAMAAVVALPGQGAGASDTATAAAAVAEPPAPVSSQPSPSPGGGGVGTLGIYALNSRVRTDPNVTTAWSIEWQVPRLENPGEAWGAVGQWMFNLETGVYYTPGDGWWVYYFDDNNGRDGNNPDCTPIWGEAGGACHAGGLGRLPVGTVVTFTYRRCTPYPAHTPDPAGSQLCAYVDVHDGQGERFLAEDSRTTVEMYAHDVETFGDGGQPEPIIACGQPTVMRRQFIETQTEPWRQLTGDQWNFEDGTDRYRFANVDRGAGRWESCSESGNLAVHQPASGSAPCVAAEGPDRAVNGTVTGGNGDKWCSAAATKWMQVDLGSVRRVNRFVVHHAGAGGESAVWNTRAYTIQLSQDGSSWSTPVNVTANTANVATHDIAAAQARYVRLNVATPTQGGNGAARIYEFEAYDVGGNLARNRPATSSTPCAAGEGPEKAVNGSVSGGGTDKWCSAAGTRWLQVDLGTTRGVQAVTLHHAEAGGESPAWNTRDYTIRLSRDGSSWSTAVNTTGNTAGSTIEGIVTTQARYVRLDVVTPTQDGNGAARIYDMEVYGL